MSDDTGIFSGDVMPGAAQASAAPMKANPGKVLPKAATKGNGRGAPGRPRNRYKRVASDASRAGVASTAAETGRAEPPRFDADESGNITRISLEDRQITTFDLPEHRKKPGWDYKWEPVTIMGMRVDRSVIRDAYKAGWRPEKAADWPELMEGVVEKYEPDGPVEEGGQMLMGRPLHLSQEAQLESYNNAKRQERDRMQQAAGGQSMQGNEGLANVRGVRVGGASLDVQLAVGSGPVGRQ